MARRRQNGTGSIWREGKLWKGRIAQADGTPKKVTGRTKQDVADMLKAIADKLAPTGYTVRTAATAWTALHSRTWRRSTADQYEYLLRVHILPQIGDRLPEDLRAKDIQQVIATMSDKGLSTATMGHARKVMHGLMDWLIQNEHIDRNPVTRIRIPETGSEGPKALSMDDIAKLLKAMETSRWCTSVRFLLLTGLRRGELLALHWEDIEDGWITIRRTRSRTGEEGPPKSKSGIRRFKAGKAVQGLLEAQEEMLHAEHIISPYVFPAESGGPIQPATYYTTLMRYAKAAGITLTVHELRHTFVSLAGRGMDIKVLQAVLGHSSSTQTLDLYQHLMGDALERASATVDEAAETIDAHTIRDIVVQLSPKSSPRHKKAGSR